MMNPFALPDLYVRLAMNPKTKAFLDQPDYRAAVEQIRLNPQLLGTWVRLLQYIILTPKQVKHFSHRKDSGCLLLEIIFYFENKNTKFVLKMSTSQVKNFMFEIKFI